MDSLGVIVNNAVLQFPVGDDVELSIEVMRGRVAFSLSRDDDNYFGGTFYLPIQFLKAIVAGAVSAGLDDEGVENVMG